MLKSALLQAIHAGADAIRAFNDLDFKVSNKEGINNLVTEVDHAAEKAIMDVIKSTFPEHFILSEEAGEIKQDSEYKWIIDPIDGTVNFAHRIPICCISIGIEHQGQMILGAVYNPFMNELFFAERGKGATLNERPNKNGRGRPRLRGSLSPVMTAMLALEALEAIAARVDERRAAARALRGPEPLPEAPTAGMILGGVVAVAVLPATVASGSSAPDVPPLRFRHFAGRRSAEPVPAAG